MAIKAPSQSDIASLPKRAAVAYSARCARRVLPLADIRYFRYTRAAVHYAEETATSVHIGVGLHGQPSRPVEWRIEEGLCFSTDLHHTDAAGAAQNSALSAFRAAAAYKGHATSAITKAEHLDSVHTLAFQAFDFADFAAAAVANFNARDIEEDPTVADSAGSGAVADAEYRGIYQVVRTAMAADFLALRSECDKRGWSDDVEVPVEVFGDWWPYGTPTAWPVSYDYPRSLDSLQRRPSVFLSHTQQDRAYAKRLADDLSSTGVKVWLDEAEIRVGDSLIEKISEGIESMEYLSVILTPNSVRSEWVKREVDIAINSEIAARRVKVLPLLFEQCELPAFLAGKAYADFTNPEGYKGALEKLLQRLGPDPPRDIEVASDDG